MTRDQTSTLSWRTPWLRWSITWLVVVTVLSLLVGFVWLPSVHADFRADGLWASICRAAGVPANWSASTASDTAGRMTSTNVVLDRAMARGAGDQAVGRGGTLALNCTMCHGARGTSGSDAPNLAGQYPEVIVKQLRDYQEGRRRHALMQGLARAMTTRDMDDLGAYYASLPKSRAAPTTYGEALPALVRVGDPLRNIAPCISCHGGVDQKIGTPWIEGMPKEYLAAQLVAFQKGDRRNDGQAQMRNMVRAMTPKEIDEISTFYARKAGGG